MNIRNVLKQRKYVKIMDCSKSRDFAQLAKPNCNMNNKTNIQLKDWHRAKRNTKSSQTTINLSNYTN